MKKKRKSEGNKGENDLDDKKVVYTLSLVLIVLISALLMISYYQEPEKVLEGELASLGLFGVDCINPDFISPDSIIPMPQNIEMLTCNNIQVDISWKIFADLDNQEDKFAADYLKDEIFEKSEGLIYLGVGDIDNINEPDWCNGVDFNQDGIVAPSEVLLIGSRIEEGVDVSGCSEENEWCDKMDINRDSFVDSIDLEIASANLLRDDCDSPVKPIIISNPNEDSVTNQIAEDNSLDVNFELGFNQGYIVSIQPEQILIFANSTTGNFYGVVTLDWLLKIQEGMIILPHTEIADWPDFKIRSFFGQRDLSYSTDEWIENLTSRKFNLWFHGSSWVSNMSSPTTIDNLLKRRKIMEDRHFYSSTLLQPTSVKNVNPNFYQGTYAYNISMKFNNLDTAELTKNPFQLGNIGFEDDTNGDNFPDYWKHHNTQWPGIWEWDCTESHSGDCSIKFNLPTDLGEKETSSFLYYSDISSETIDPINLEPDSYYILSFWAKKIGNENNKRQPQMTVVARDPITNEQYDKSKIIRKTGSWNKYSLHFSTAENHTQISLWSRAYETDSLTLWLDDFKITKLNDELLNVLKTRDTRLHVYNKDRTIEYGEDTDYILDETGEINIADIFEGKKTEINRISSGNIPANAEIKVDYDFAAYSSKGLWPSLSDPDVFPVYEEYMVKPTMELFKPEIVFVNIDEMSGVNKDSRDLKRGLKNYQLIANYVEKITNIIKTYDSDVKIAIWADMQNPFHNGNIEYIFRTGGPKGKTWYALDFLDRSLIQIPWWYHDMDYRRTISMSPVLFKEYGFEFIGGPGTYVPLGDASNTIRHIKWWSYVSYRNNALGLMPSSFFGGFEGYLAGANYSWNAFKEQVGCDPEFIEICDGIDNDCDNLHPTGSYTYSEWLSNIDEGFDLDVDLFNCGECSNICYYSRGYSSCLGGVCQFDGCYEYFYDANEDLGDGCECSFTNNEIEICDGLDNDCNGEIDEELDCPSPDPPTNGGNGDTGGGEGGGGSGSGRRVTTVYKSNETLSTTQQDSQQETESETEESPKQTSTEEESEGNEKSVFSIIIIILIVLIIVVFGILLSRLWIRRKRIQTLKQRNVVANSQRHGSLGM